MESSFDLFFGGLEEEDESSLNVLRIRKRIRDHSNPLELPNTKFLSYFRLSKEAFVYVLDEIKDFLKQPQRSSAIPPILKLATVLRFVAEGSYQKCSGNDFNLGMAQPTVSVVLKEVLDVLENRICPNWIKAELTNEEQKASKLYFYQKTGFPGVIGCVDGTHVRIIAPAKNLQHLYLNRKGYYSLNVMIVCDHKMNVRFVDSRYPGANHDSFVWNLSEYKLMLDSLSENTWILGDAGYPLEQHLMTPFRSTTIGTPESRFNTIHAQARNIIERTIGIMKNKFRCLLSARGLHYKPKRAAQFVNACCALHNISQHYKVVYPDEMLYADTDTDDVNFHEIDDAANTRNETGARAIRNNIMRSL